MRMLPVEEDEMMAASSSMVGSSLGSLTIRSMMMMMGISIYLYISIVRIGLALLRQR